MQLYEMTAHEIRDALRGKNVSAQEVLESVLGRINEVEDDINSYITETREFAMQTAREVDKRIALNEALPDLAGVPMGIKDNILISGIPTTCASHMLETFVPPYSAHVIETLDNAGAVLTGKLNLDEFAMGSSTETSYFQTTVNPYDISRVSGGSSGGSAAAVSAGEAIFSLGSDTGGSIRQPAAFCGVVGLKPTYGLVSRFGAVAFSSSLDQIGPLTRDVTDCALVLSAIAGHDGRDATSLNVQTQNYARALNADIKGLRVGIPREYMQQAMDAPIKQKVLDAAKTLEGLGALVTEVSLPAFETALSAYFIISCCEASSNLAKFDSISYGHRTLNYHSLNDMIKKSRGEGFGTEVKRRVMMGTFALSAGYYDAYYGRAQTARECIRADYRNAFNQVDVLLCPATPQTAFKKGGQINDPIKMYAGDLFTVSANIGGVPAMSVPAGLDPDGLPIGVQLVAPHLMEQRLLNTAYALEQTGFTKLPRPELGKGGAAQ